MPNYDINYEDERFKQVENQKQEQLNNINNTYNNMVNQSDQFYQNQIDAVNNYADIQKQNQQANTDFAIEQINQQKEQAKKDYTKEQAGAYADWQKQSNKYGVNAEQVASQGLNNTGYSATLERDYYSTYQNRIISAKESYNKAVLNYDNSIKEAMLANNSALAEIAYNALKTQLELSLQGFQYKNDLLQTQINMQRDIDKDYYNRWQDVQQQINTENTLKENIRQYNENMAYQKEQDRIKMAYQKERDRIADEQWQKQYNLSLASRYSSGGGGSSSGGSSAEVSTAYYEGKKAANVGNFGYFSNGYQPKGILINGKPYKLEGTRQYIINNTVDRYGNPQKVQQQLWKANGKLYYWEGRQNKYLPYE